MKKFTKKIVLLLTLTFIAAVAAGTQAGEKQSQPWLVNPKDALIDAAKQYSANVISNTMNGQPKPFQPTVPIILPIIQHPVPVR